LPDFVLKLNLLTNLKVKYHDAIKFVNAFSRFDINLENEFGKKNPLFFHFIFWVTPQPENKTNGPF